MSSPPPTIAPDALLRVVGHRLRARRQDLGWTQSELAERAGVSLRFLLKLEKGTGNISIARLAGVCAALELTLSALFVGLGPGAPEATDKLALVGLRGAGKSTIGRAVAAETGAAFIELDAEIEAETGMTVGEIFELGGEARMGVVEQQVLARILEQPEPMVIATGGGLPTRPAWSLLRARARTAWLQASPGAHLARVTAQGDLRPMAGRDHALAELEALLDARAPRYAEADLTVDTEAVGLAGAVRMLRRA